LFDRLMFFVGSHI